MFWWTRRDSNPHHPADDFSENSLPYGISPDGTAPPSALLPFGASETGRPPNVFGEHHYAAINPTCLAPGSFERHL